MCSDPDTDGRWQVLVGDCYPLAALADFYAAHKDISPSTMVGVTLLPPGREARDPLVFDPTAAARAYAEHQARLGLTDDT